MNKPDIINPFTRLQGFLDLRETSIKNAIAVSRGEVIDGFDTSDLPDSLRVILIRGYLDKAKKSTAILQSHGACVAGAVEGYLLGLER